MKPTRKKQFLKNARIDSEPNQAITQQTDNYEQPKSAHFEQSPSLLTPIRLPEFSPIIGDCGQSPHGEKSEESGASPVDMMNVDENFGPNLTVSIDIGNGHVEQLIVTSRDDPQQLAERFCTEQNLSEEMQRQLCMQLKQNMEIHLNSQEDSPPREPHHQLGDQLQLNKRIDSQGYKPTASHSQDDGDNDSSRPTIPRQFDRKRKPNSEQTDGTQDCMAAPSLMQQLANRCDIFDSPHDVSFKNSKGKVFWRLFQNAVQKQSKQRVNEKLLRSPPQPKYASKKPVEEAIASGTRMYTKGLKGIECQKQFAQKEKQEFTSKQMEKCTFTPKVNRPSPRPRKLRFINLSSQKNNGLQSEERMIRSWHQLKDRQVQMKEQQAQAEQEACSFTPTLNRKSEKLFRSSTTYRTNLDWLKDMRQINTERARTSIERQSKSAESSPARKLLQFMRLYEESQERKTRQEEVYSQAIDAECTFQPELNLRTSRSQSRYLETKIKPVSTLPEGCTFAPEINNSKIKTLTFRQKAKLLKTQVKSLLSPEKTQRARRKSMTSQDERELRGKPAISQVSKQLLEKTLYEKFNQIFQCLDSDSDRLISKDKIDTIGLPFEVIEILDPIFEELTHIEHSITQDEFIEQVSRVYETLNFEQRNHILQFNRNKRGAQLAQFSHQPNADNPNKPRRKAVDMYARQMHRKKYKESQLHEHRLGESMIEQRRYSFRPDITPLTITQVSGFGNLSQSMYGRKILSTQSERSVKYNVDLNVSSYSAAQAADSVNRSLRSRLKAQAGDSENKERKPRREQALTVLKQDDLEFIID